MVRDKKVSPVLEERSKKALSMIQPNSIYFAHPINFYNTPHERDLIKKITGFFPEYHVENPNQTHHQENYPIWKQETGSGMNYYLDIILPYMDAGIYLPFQDGMIGAGIFGEMEFLYNFGKNIWQINHNKQISRIFNLDLTKRLSVEDTKKRVY